MQVSSERIVIFKLVEGREKAVQTLGYSDLLTAQPVSVQVRFLICLTQFKLFTTYITVRAWKGEEMKDCVACVCCGYGIRYFFDLCVRDPE